MADHDVTTADCPKCKCPAQPIGLQCGFCGATIVPPAGALTAAGTVNAEEVIGYRGWKIDTDNPTGRPRLRSPMVTTMVWTPEGEDGEGWYTARCIQADGQRPPFDPHHHGPDNPNDHYHCPVKECNDPGHGCGFYAGRSREHLISMHYGRYTESDMRIVGKVQMAGKVFPATNGWRAQLVRPHTLYVPHEAWRIAAMLKEDYAPFGVEVDVFDHQTMPAPGTEGAIDWCIKCSSRMPKRSRTCGLCGHTHI